MPKTLPTADLPAKGSMAYEPALDIVRFFAFFAVFLHTLLIGAETQ